MAVRVRLRVEAGGRVREVVALEAKVGGGSVAGKLKEAEVLLL
jgi:hypothetical protein